MLATNWKRDECFIINCISFLNKLNSVGPIMEPWGTTDGTTKLRHCAGVLNNVCSPLEVYVQTNHQNKKTGDTQAACEEDVRGLRGRRPYCSQSKQRPFVYVKVGIG